MRKFVGFAAVAISTTFAACGGAKNTSENLDRACMQRSTSSFTAVLGGTILDGQDALAKQTVLIFGQKASDFTLCTGTPIASDVILTAAHCVDSRDKVRVAFKANAYCDTGFTLSGSTILAQKTVIHPAYDEDIKAKNDLALIKLVSRMPADYQVSELYDGSTSITSTDAILVGYGKTTELNSSDAELRYVLKKMNKEIGTNKEKTLLVSDQSDGKGMCQGDSGGPVFIESHGKLLLAGINSAVQSRATSSICRNKGYAMYVPHYLEWIQMEMEKLRQ